MNTANFNLTFLYFSPSAFSQISRFVWETVFIDALFSVHSHSVQKLGWRHAHMLCNWFLNWITLENTFPFFFSLVFSLRQEALLCCTSWLWTQNPLSHSFLVLPLQIMCYSALLELFLNVVCDFKKFETPGGTGGGVCMCGRQRWSDDSAVKGCFSRWTGFSPQHLHGPQLTIVCNCSPRESLLASEGTCTHGTHRYSWS